MQFVNRSKLTKVLIIAVTGFTFMAEASAVNHKICWEAEQIASLIPPVVRVPPVPLVDPDNRLRTNFSGTGYVEITQHTNTGGGGTALIGNQNVYRSRNQPVPVTRDQAVYKIKAQIAGTYYLWARLYRSTHCEDILSVAVNHGLPKILGNDSTHNRYNQWHWVGGIPVYLKYGQNTVVLKSRGFTPPHDRYARPLACAGIDVDQFFLSQDALYVPTGKRTSNKSHATRIVWEAELVTSLAKTAATGSGVSPASKAGQTDIVMKLNHSGRGYLEIPGDQTVSTRRPMSKGQAVYKIKAPVAGTYYLWARTMWTSGQGNSIAVSVNNSVDKILGEDGTYDKWHWVGGAARFHLKSGENTIVLKNREAGVCIDQFFLCQDGAYTPTGKRTPTQ